MIVILLAVVVRHQATCEIIHALAPLALRTEVVVNDITDFRIRAGTLVGERLLRDQQSYSAAHGKRSQHVIVFIQWGGTRLHRLDDHVDLERAIGPDVEFWMEGRNLDVLPIFRHVEAERLSISSHVFAQNTPIGVLLNFGQAVGIAEYEVANGLEGTRAHAVPTQCVLREKFSALAADTAQAESLHEGVAYSL